MDNSTHINTWFQYIYKILNNYPQSSLYLKGGSVVGILLLKLIDEYDIFETSYNEFNKMDLIKDYDFVLEWEECCSYDFYFEFGKEFGITLNGYMGNNPKIVKNRLLNVMRSPLTDLFEMSVCIKDECYELPLTSMKLYITKYNIENIFKLIEKINTNQLCKDDLQFLKNINIDIHDCIDGMFNISTLNTYNLSPILINIINNISPNIIHKQCLYNLIQNPTNLSRLKWKNVNKSNLIKQFYTSHIKIPSLSLPSWLLNEELILSLTSTLIKFLSQTTNNIYLKYKTPIDAIINNINDLQREYIYYDCCYDLVGIGSDPSNVIINLNNNIKMDTFFKLSIERVENIRLKCERYSVIFSNDMMGINYGKMKKMKKDEICIEMGKLLEMYKLLFNDWLDVFNGCNIVRWKDNIKLYRDIPNTDAIQCLIDIFNFNIMTQLDYDNSIKLNTNKISNNSVWLLIMELKRTNKKIDI
jgi:hypothetical protein